MESYRQSCVKIDCKYYADDPKSCPFGSSCFYRHMNKDGSIEVYQKPRVIVNEQGVSVPIQGAKVSFLSLAGLPDRLR